MAWAMSRTKVSYHAMRARCLNPKHPAFSSYRTITICQRWLESYESFLADMGERQLGMTLDRKDNSGNYEPSNCRWATHREQQRNMKSNRILERNGEKKTAVAWADEYGLPPHVLYNRLRHGWAVEKALSVPKEPRQGRMTHSTVRLIRSMYATAKYTQRELAQLLGTNNAAVSQIVNGQRFRNVVDVTQEGEQA